MKVFYCTDHEGYYPVGVCSLIVAPTEVEAYISLKAELVKRGLKVDDPFTLIELNTSIESVSVLLDGNY